MVNSATGHCGPGLPLFRVQVAAEERGSNNVLADRKQRSELRALRQ